MPQPVLCILITDLVSAPVTWPAVEGFNSDLDCVSSTCKARQYPLLSHHLSHPYFSPAQHRNYISHKDLLGFSVMTVHIWQPCFLTKKRLTFKSQNATRPCSLQTVHNLTCSGWKRGSNWARGMEGKKSYIKTSIIWNYDHWYFIQYSILMK